MGMVEREAKFSLFGVIACPNCMGELSPKGDSIECSDCRSVFEVKDSIPLLYPREIDEEHLAEEELLAQRMVQASENEAASFVSHQWHNSKDEIWEVLRKEIGARSQKILNIGCGYDYHFKEFQDAGHAFVNFDIVFGMLAHLQIEWGAKYCIAGDIHQMPLQPASFDFVICIDTIHHEASQIPKILREITRPLTEAGTLVLVDPNSMGLFQFPKSLFLHKPLYRTLRQVYHRLRRCSRKPADYEFPTNVFHVRRLLSKSGFSRIETIPQSAYPGIGPGRFRLYSLLRRIEWVARYANYHYVFKASKKPETA